MRFLRHSSKRFLFVSVFRSALVATTVSLLSLEVSESAKHTATIIGQILYTGRDSVWQRSLDQLSRQCLRILFQRASFSLRLPQLLYIFRGRREHRSKTVPKRRKSFSLHVHFFTKSHLRIKRRRRHSNIPYLERKTLKSWHYFASLKKVLHALAGKKRQFIFIFFHLTPMFQVEILPSFFEGKLTLTKSSHYKHSLAETAGQRQKYFSSLVGVNFLCILAFLPLFLLLCHATVLPNQITLVWMALWGENRPKNRIRISTGFYGPRLLGLTTHKGGEEDHPRGTRELFLSLLRPPPPPCLPRQKWKRRKEKEGIN